MLRASLIILLALVFTGGAEANSGGADRVLSLVNQARVNAGLLPLAVNPQLTAAAQAHADDMARNGVSIGHNGSDGSTPSTRILAAGYHPYSWGLIGGENWAAYRTVDESMNAWMSDQPHRANVLSPGFREIGVGAAQSPSGAPILVTDFGSQPNTLPVFMIGTGPIVTLQLSNEDAAPRGDGPNVIGQALTIEISTDPSFSQLSSQQFAISIRYSSPEGQAISAVYVRFHDASGRSVVSKAIASDIIPVAPSAPSSTPKSVSIRKPVATVEATVTRTVIRPPLTATTSPTEEPTPLSSDELSLNKTLTSTPTTSQTVVLRRPVPTQVYVDSASAVTAEASLFPSVAMWSFAASGLVFAFAAITALRMRRR
jgi:hypothetical protein